MAWLCTNPPQYPRFGGVTKIERIEFRTIKIKTKKKRTSMCVRENLGRSGGLTNRRIIARLNDRTFFRARVPTRSRPPLPPPPRVLAAEPKVGPSDTSTTLDNPDKNSVTFSVRNVTKFSPPPSPSRPTPSSRLQMRETRVHPPFPVFCPPPSKEGPLFFLKLLNVACTY